MATPRSIDVSVTSRCNLRCAYCSHFTSPTDVESDLPLEAWADFYRTLSKAAVLKITLQGGEPLLREDLGGMLDAVVANRMRFSILTNGMLADERMAMHIAQTGRCDTVQVSIDGSRAEVHDAFRGQGSFAAAVRGLETLKRAGVDVSVRVTVHRHNVDDLEPVARFLLEDLGLPGFSTNAASFLGLCRIQASGIQLDAPARSRAMASLLALDRNYPGRIGASAGPLAEARMWHGMMKAKTENRPLEGGGRLSSCGGVFSSLAVRADGAIVPCVQLGHMVLGRMGEDDLVDVWRDHPALQRLRRRGEIRLEDVAFCNGCEFVPWCRGGCPALAFTLTGDENHPSPDACLKRFLEAGGELPDHDR